MEDRWMCKLCGKISKKSRKQYAVILFTKNNKIKTKKLRVCKECYGALKEIIKYPCIIGGIKKRC